MKVKNKKISLELQNAAILELFPSFRYQKGRKIWTGYLQPTINSIQYKISIEYREYISPKVFVLNPQIEQFVPHRFPDNSLCLFYPQDASWQEKSLIAKTIIPWTAEWLFFYELWMATGHWLGKEAPHSTPKVGNF